MPALELSEATLLSLRMSDMMDLQDAERFSLREMQNNPTQSLFLDPIKIVWRG